VLVQLVHTDIDHQRLADEMHQLLGKHDLHQLQQVSLTSLDGSNDWLGSTGKQKDLRYHERFWSEVNSAVQGTYMHECIQRYGQYYRWRLMKLDQKTTYSVHSDSQPGLVNYRLHIPIITNIDSYMVFYDQRPADNTTTSCTYHHLAAGNSYCVNTTGLHTAVNFGVDHRYHMVGVRYENSNNGSH